MAKVPHGVEILPKISIAWVGCTNVTDDRQTTDRRQTDDRQTDRRWQIANMNLSSRSLKMDGKSSESVQWTCWGPVTHALTCAQLIQYSAVYRFGSLSKWTRPPSLPCTESIQRFRCGKLYWQHDRGLGVRKWFCKKAHHTCNRRVQQRIETSVWSSQTRANHIIRHLPITKQPKPLNILTPCCRQGMHAFKRLNHRVNVSKLNDS